MERLGQQLITKVGEAVHMYMYTKLLRSDFNDILKTCSLHVDCDYHRTIGLG